MYGPGLALSDFNLGILYMLAVSSLSTYGILLAGFYYALSPDQSLGEFQENLLKARQLEAKHFYNVRSTISWWLAQTPIFRLYGIEGIWVRSLATSAQSFVGYFHNKKKRIVLYLPGLVLLYMAWLFLYIGIISLYLNIIYLFVLLFFIYLTTVLSITVFIGNLSGLCKEREEPKNYPVSHSSIKKTKLLLVLGNRKQSFSTCSSYRTKDKALSVKNLNGAILDNRTEFDPNKIKGEDLKGLHSVYIKVLFTDRNATVKPFDSTLIATCYNCLDKDKKSEFLKEWGSKSCIYLIQYKYNPLIYYIGRTTLLKRRFNNHLKADTGSKLHVFLSLVGLEYFNFSIVEICTPSEQGARENYYLQKYLPILNTTFSSAFSESAIYANLTSKLATLKLKSDPHTNGKAIPVYVYDINDKCIDINYVKYDSITKASHLERVAGGTLAVYINTNVPFRNKLYYSKPIIDLDFTFSQVKTLSSGLNLDSNIAKKVWVYEAKTLDSVKGSPFPSKMQASASIGVSRNVISYFMDTGKAEGVKGTYIFSRPLLEREITKLQALSQTVKLGNKQVVFAYDAKRLELINNSPFASLELAAVYFKVNYRTISRHLDTKLATTQDKKDIYLFSKELSLDLKSSLLNTPAKAAYSRQEFWVYKVGDNNILTLIPNQPFKTKREALKALGVHLSVFNKYLDSKKMYKDIFIFSCEATAFGVYSIDGPAKAK
jgi:hypothetical protein